MSLLSIKTRGSIGSSQTNPFTMVMLRSLVIFNGVANFLVDLCQVTLSPISSCGAVIRHRGSS